MFIHKDERGMTLVELLAGLAILGIVTILASTFLLQSIKYNAKAEKNVNLSQEANIFVTALRNQEDHDFEICYKTGDLTVDGASVLDLDERYFKTLMIRTPSENDNLALTPGLGNCINIKQGETIEVDLTLKAELKNPKKNETEPSFRLKTTIDRFDNFLIE
ncbi:type II secretion system protein [Pontibacillus salipaludis]|uniref:type II secretion system protein n=1 Tax=Pontibacillus salipaludis TaxID=1697394 RepID=UPI0031EE0810